MVSRRLKRWCNEGVKIVCIRLSSLKTWNSTAASKNQESTTSVHPTRMMCLGLPFNFLYLWYMPGSPKNGASFPSFPLLQGAIRKIERLGMPQAEEIFGDLPATTPFHLFSNDCHFHNKNLTTRIGQGFSSNRKARINNWKYLMQKQGLPRGQWSRFE